MLRKLLATPNDPVLTILRLVLAAVFFAHGAQKALGWFGGFGYQATMDAFTKGMGIPAPLAFIAIATEFAGSIALAFGLLGRIAALGIACVMVVAVAKVHLPNGFFMNWSGKQPGEGYEYHLLVIAIAIAIVVKGCGALSVDRMLANRPSPPKA